MRYFLQCGVLIMAKFTSGKWEVLIKSPGKDIDNIVRMNRVTKNKYDAVPYACIGGFPDTDPKEEIEANAHLIAAAPDMYALLDELSAFLSFKVKDDTLKGLKLNVDTLLSKARGES